MVWLAGCSWQPRKLVEHAPVGGEAEQHRRFEQHLHTHVSADGALLQGAVDGHANPAAVPYKRSWVQRANALS
jgi:hypothetical protein